MNPVKILVDLFRESGNSTIIDYQLIQEYVGFDIREGKRYLMKTVKRALESEGRYISPIRGQGYYIDR